MGLTAKGRRGFGEEEVSRVRGRWYGQEATVWGGSGRDRDRRRSCEQGVSKVSEVRMYNVPKLIQTCLKKDDTEKTVRMKEDKTKGQSYTLFFKYQIGLEVLRLQVMK